MRRAFKASLNPLRARSRALLAVILPALVLRAIIPVGFMPVAASGGPAMQLCPGAAAMAGTLAGHHHHPGGDAPGGTAHNTLCVFAASAAPAMAPVAAAIPLRAADVSCAEQSSANSVSLPSILRTQSARAPPSLA
jgi:hypothetical protein